ncbi:Uncharacterised protein [uncultured archaeon]|nr:Uncharacterised protein [uncultured archaeon]
MRKVRPAHRPNARWLPRDQTAEGLAKRIAREKKTLWESRKAAGNPMPKYGPITAEKVLQNAQLMAKERGISVEHQLGEFWRRIQTGNRWSTGLELARAEKRLNTQIAKRKPKNPQIDTY